MKNTIDNPLRIEEKEFPFSRSVISEYVDLSVAKELQTQLNDAEVAVINCHDANKRLQSKLSKQSELMDRMAKFISGQKDCEDLNNNFGAIHQECSDLLTEYNKLKEDSNG